MTVLVIVETVVLVVLVILVAGLLRAYGDVLRRLESGGTSADGPVPFRVKEGLPAPAVAERNRAAEVGDVAHDISGVTPGGEVVSLRAVDVPHDSVLLFLSSSCTGCETFWEELRRPLDLHLPAGIRLIVITRGSDHEQPDLVGELAPEGIDVVMSTECWSDYGVPGSPYVVLVSGATGRIRGEGTGQSWRQVSELLGHSGDMPRTGGARRADDVDHELMAAGIFPGDPRLYAADDEQVG